MQEAIILKGYGGFYTLLTAEGRKIVCKTRGKLRKENGDILVGDKVMFSQINEMNDDLAEGVIEEILPRKNSLIRPKLANIDGALLLLSAKNPAPDWLLLDKMLLLTAFNDITPIICFNKTDLLSVDELQHLQRQVEEYKITGFPCFFLSVQHNQGIEALQSEIKSGLWILAGNSGVGKSTLTNLILGSETMQVGAIGERIKRGKHTTRHIEITAMANGVLWADTPGFSLLDIPEKMTEEEMASYYPDFHNLGTCRFDGCLHYKEPDCAVKQAVYDGKIGRQRYERYKQLLEMLKEREVKY